MSQASALAIGRMFFHFTSMGRESLFHMANIE